MTTWLRPMVLALGIVTPLSATAAGITININGVAGSNLTTWTFSGSETVELNILDVDDLDGNISFGALVGAAFYSGPVPTSAADPLDFDLTGDARFVTTNDTDGVAEFGANSRTFDILAVGPESSSPSTLFGFSIDDQVVGQRRSSYDFDVGTTLTFSGSATAAVDISVFAAGITTSKFWETNEAFANLPANQSGFDITWAVGIPPSTIPVPATLPLLLGALAVGGVLVRRRKTQA